MVSVYSDYSDVSTCPPPKPFPAKRLRVGEERTTSARVLSKRASSASASSTQLPKSKGQAAPSRPQVAPARADSSAAPAAHKKVGEQRRVLFVELNGKFNDECSAELQAPYAPTGVDMADLTWGGMERRHLALAK
ncbi:hypothetical protein CCYA_CCYA10G2978 [Cyanidiococcus yangmingshanensis]|nr:hypothetical protein CCYA_CCYA10G2978 [Cyanidiococcus yangmingshanensis]